MIPRAGLVLRARGRLVLGGFGAFRAAPGRAWGGSGRGLEEVMGGVWGGGGRGLGRGGRG